MNLLQNNCDELIILQVLHMAICMYVVVIYSGYNREDIDLMIVFCGLSNKYCAIVHI